MLNQVVLVGRIYSDIEFKKLPKNKSIAYITLAVPRNYKDVNGEYQTDYIKVTAWDSVAENTCEYVKIGDIVGVKGKLTCDNVEDNIQVTAEKVTFLSSQKENES